VRRERPGREDRDVQRKLGPRPGIHRPAQRREQIEHVVDKHRDRQDVAAPQQGKLRALVARPLEERPDDALRRAAVHQALPDERRHQNWNADGYHHIPKRLRRFGRHLTDRHLRRNHADGERRDDEPDERRQLQPHQQENHQRETDRERNHGIAEHYKAPNSD